MFKDNYRNYFPEKEFKRRFSLSNTSDIILCSTPVYSSLTSTLIFGVIEQSISNSNTKQLNQLYEKCQKIKRENRREMERLTEFLEETIDCLKLELEERKIFRLLSLLYEKKEQIKSGVSLLRDEIDESILQTFSEQYYVRIVKYVHDPENQQIVIESNSQPQNFGSTVRLVKLFESYHLVYKFSLEDMDQLCKMTRGVRTQYQKGSLRQNQITKINSEFYEPQLRQRQQQTIKILSPIARQNSFRIRKKINIVDEIAIERLIPERNPWEFNKRLESQEVRSIPDSSHSGIPRFNFPNYDHSQALDDSIVTSKSSVKLDKQYQAVFRNIELGEGAGKLGKTVEMKMFKKPKPEPMEDQPPIILNKKNRFEPNLPPVSPSPQMRMKLRSADKKRLFE